MPSYQFVCSRCETEFDHHLSFADYDKLETKEISVSCPECKTQNVEKVMICRTALCLELGPLDGDPKTVGTLAERNSKFRIPQAEEEADRKREQRIKEGKKVKPKEVSTWWDKPERQVTRELLDERKAKKNEFIRKSTAHPNNSNRPKNKSK